MRRQKIGISGYAADPAGHTTTEKNNSLVSGDKRLLTSQPSTVYRCKKCRQVVASEENVITHIPGAGLTSFKWRKRGVKGSGTDEPVQPECTSIFVQPMQWMTPGTTLSCVNVAEIRMQSYWIVFTVLVFEFCKVWFCRFLFMYCSAVYRLLQVAGMASSWQILALSSWVLKFPVKVDMHTFNVAVQEGMVESKLQCVKCEARLGNFNWAGMQCSCGTWVNPAFQLHKSRVDAAPLWASMNSCLSIFGTFMVSSLWHESISTSGVLKTVCTWCRRSQSLPSWYLWWCGLILCE